PHIGLLYFIVLYEGSISKESREVFFCYVFIRKKLPVTGSVDTKKQKFCKKIKKLKNSVDRCMINMV
ncbi:hypothetical protein, partial [Dorea longicatena]|uniref:hypothetical protein n=1 Tax=Dorea longicatena TaxID=88431 RepID=UPI001A9AAABA